MQKINGYRQTGWCRILYRSLVILLAMLLSLGFFNRGYAVLIPYLFSWLTITVLKKKEYAYAFAFATLLGLAWVYFGAGLYSYKNNALVLLGINIFTLNSFSLGLLGVYIVFRQIEEKIVYRKLYRRLILFTTIYWILLIAFEWGGYHVVGIRNAAYETYPGIIFLDCMHAPRLMQLAYFSFGPVFFLLFNLFYRKFRFPGNRLGRFFLPFSMNGDG